MVANKGEVITLIFPESNLNSWVRLLIFLESIFWVLLQNILDLFGPMIDSVFKKGSLILA